MGKDKKEIMISEKRVKLHVFEPSQRRIWTIVGMGKEYWLEPSLRFCSCEGYYFGKIKGKTLCYHLDAVRDAELENNVEIIKFSDDEYSIFLSSLLAEL